MPNLREINGAVLVVGDVMTDIIVRPEGPLVRGSDRRAKITLTAGGSGANQAVWLGSFDVPVSLFARVGAEDVAQLEAAFRRDGVAPLLASDSDHQSGRLITLVDPDGERSFLTDRGANLFLCDQDLPAQWWGELGLLQVSGYSFFEPMPRVAVQGMIEVARRYNVPVSVDPASAGFIEEVGAAAFLEWIGKADFLFANAEEAAVLTGSDKIGNQLAILGKQFDTVVIKQGSKGVVASDRGGVVVSVAGLPVEAVDSTGAGDAFLAGFVAARRQLLSLDECLQAGNRAGARAVQKLGGRP